MEAELFGTITKPALVMAGSWDPVLPEHVALMDRLVNYAQKEGMTAVVVMLDPAPSSFVLQKTRPGLNWVTYNDADINMHIFRRRGVDAILKIDFQESFLDMGVQELFQAIKPHAHVAEFWFGAQQRFGNGDNGSQATLVRYARHENIRLRRLANLKVGERSYLVRNCLQHGQLAEAFQMARIPPVRKRPTISPEMRLPWKAGNYLAIPLDTLPTQMIMNRKQMIPLQLHAAEQGHSTMQWPSDDIQYLAFTAGPVDIGVMKQI